LPQTCNLSASASWVLPYRCAPLGLWPLWHIYVGLLILSFADSQML
jgi:hypothetical protein